MGIMSVIAAVTSVLKYFDLQFFTMIAMVYNRFFYFVIAPMIVGNLWGMEKQSMIYGFILFCAATFNLLGYVFNDIVVHYLNGNFTIINVVLGACCFVFSFWLVYLLRGKIK